MSDEVFIGVMAIVSGLCAGLLLYQQNWIASAWAFNYLLLLVLHAQRRK